MQENYNVIVASAFFMLTVSTIILKEILKRNAVQVNNLNTGEHQHMSFLANNKSTIFFC